MTTRCATCGTPTTPPTAQLAGGITASIETTPNSAVLILSDSLRWLHLMLTPEQVDELATWERDATGYGVYPVVETMRIAFDCDTFVDVARKRAGMAWQLWTLTDADIAAIRTLAVAAQEGQQ